VDDVVSGRMTPTSPLPAAVSGCSLDMYEKLTSKDETLRSDGTLAEGADDDDGLGPALPPLEPPHAAAASSARVVTASISGRPRPRNELTFMVPPPARLVIDADARLWARCWRAS
jgi:hypothetical protein